VLTFWLTCWTVLETAMEDHNSIQFPSQGTPEPLGILDDMQGAVGLVDDALLAARPHPPVIFGAGGPMYVRILTKEFICLIQCMQAKAV